MPNLSYKPDLPKASGWLIGAVYCGWLVMLSLSCIGQALAKQPLTFDVLPRELQQILTARQLSTPNFEPYLAAVNAQTIQREQRGEWEHFVYFTLQSARFTNLPKIEPALSAYEFVQQLEPAVRTRYLHEDEYVPAASTKLPVAVVQRFRALQKAFAQKTTDERLAYFRQLFTQGSNAQSDPEGLFATAYMRAMKFLYQKEFLAPQGKSPAQLAAQVAHLYQTRAHSTDTQIEANYTIYEALAGLKAQRPDCKLQRILIVGPGQDFAPRTDFIEMFAPQSYQPFAVADMLLQLELSALSDLQIHCVDINPRVVSHLQGLARRKSFLLTIISGLAQTAQRQYTPEYRQYFAQLGKRIGTELPLNVPDKWQTHLRKQIQVQPELLSKVTAQSLNIVTERFTAQPQFDLVIVTNVFPYFNQTELMLALANIASMLKPGSLLIHNESRQELLSFAALAGIPSVTARTVLLGGTGATALYDGVVIHQKKPSL